MSGTLIVWKAPRVTDEGEAAHLLRDYYATGDETAFEPSPDVERFYEEIVALHPPRGAIDDDTPTWSSFPERSDRVIALDYSWSAAAALLDDVDRLAREHGLVLYDPQGPHVQGPDDPPVEPYVPDAREVLRVSLLALAALAIAVGAWYASITVLSWLVIAVTGFLFVMATCTLVVYARDAYRQRRTRARVGV